MADAEERRELLKYPARCVVRSWDNLLSWKRGEIIAKFNPQKQVFAQSDLYAAAQREYGLPLIPWDKACDFRNRLRKWLWAGDDVPLGASAAGDEGPQVMLAILEMKQQFIRQCVRLALNVGFYTGCSKERVAIVEQVTKFAGNAIGDVLANDHARSETVADAGLRRADA